MGRVAAQIAAASKQLGDIKTVIDSLDDEARNRVVPLSSWNIGQHMEHTLIIVSAIAGEIKRLAEDQDATILRTGGPKWLVYLVFALGSIPRGRGKSPERFLPGERVSREKLLEAWETGRDSVSALEPLEGRILKARGRIAHPVFGPLRADQWLRILIIHTGHHIKIMNEIAAVPA